MIFDVVCMVSVQLILRTLGVHRKSKENLFDCKAKHGQFEPGDEVLVLLHIVDPPFQAKFSGPYLVKNQVSEHEYLIHRPDR